MPPDNDFARTVLFPPTETPVPVDNDRLYGFAYMRVGNDMRLVWQPYVGAFMYIYGVYLGVRQTVEEFLGDILHVFYELDDRLRPVRLISTALLPEDIRKTLNLFCHQIHDLSMTENEFDSIKTFTNEPIPPVPDAFVIHN